MPHDGLESNLSTKRDLVLLHLWKSVLDNDFILAKPSQIYRWLVGILFGAGISYMILISNLSPHYLLNQSQKIPFLFHNAILKSSTSTSPSNVNVLELMDNITKTQRSVIIDVNLTTIRGLQPKNVDVVQYQNMSTTWHQLNDVELRQKVSKASTKSKGSNSAFMFIVKSSMPFNSLWERYFYGYEDQYSIYIHASPNYIPTFNTKSPFFGRFVPSEVAKWGRVSLQEAENRLLFNALLDDTNNWFVLLSESCIPIDNFSNTYKYMTDSNYNFIMSFQESKVLHKTRLNKGKHWKMAPEVVVGNFQKGSQWFQIKKDLALLVATDVTYYKKFVNYFCQPHPLCYIDEHYLPTLFFIARSKALAFRTLTYFTFKHNSPHPNKWDKTNTNIELIKKIREGHTCRYNGHSTTRCYFFARKFDPSALPNLLALAYDIMGIP